MTASGEFMRDVGTDKAGRPGQGNLQGLGNGCSSHSAAIDTTWLSPAKLPAISAISPLT